MANTLIPIQTYTLASTTSSVTFSNIPQKYTDLKVLISARGDTANTGYERRSLYVAPNGSLSNITSKLIFSGSPGSSASYTTGVIGFIPTSDAAASTFGSLEITFMNYTSSTNKSYSAEVVCENNTSDFNKFTDNIFAGLWSQTAAITSLTFTVDSASFVSGSTFTLYGVSNGVKATGGTIVCAGGYAYHTFTSTGSFVPNQKITNAEILTVAGGGGGGGTVGGGGGAGGLLYASSQTLNAGNSYTAVIGAGGSGTTTNGNSGSNSVFSSFTAIGGGYGGTFKKGVGGVGGSGGGGGGGDTSAGTADTTGALGTVGQGNNGGLVVGGATVTGGSGGGGAGAVGGAPVAGSPYNGAAGGNGSSAYTAWGLATSTGQYAGSVYYYAGGGGGSADYVGVSGGQGGIGGFGGGGKGADSTGTGTAATANTGGGGGGGSYSGGTPQAGGAGGSGIIIVRYPLA